MWWAFGSGWPSVRYTPQWRHLVSKSGTTSCHLDVWSAFGSGQLDSWSAFGSDWPSVKHTPIETSSEQEWYYIRSAWHLVSLELSQVTLTFGQPLGQADLHSNIPPVEASSEQEWYYIRSAWHLVSLGQVTLTFGGPLGQADLQSDILPGRGIYGQEQYYMRSAWHLVSLWVRLTFSQMYPLVEASREQEWYCIMSVSHLVSLWVRSASHVVSLWSGWPSVRCTPSTGI